MSSDRITRILEVVGLTLMAIQVWDIFDRRHVLLTVMAVVAWIAGASMVIYSNYRNIKAARDAQSRQAVVDNRSGQRIAELQTENKSLQQKESSLRSENTQLVKALEGKQHEIHEMERRYLENLERTKIIMACSMLADEAEQLWDKLRGIDAEARVPGQLDKDAIEALKNPLDDVPWPWHSRALLEFRYMYGAHQTRIGKFAPSGFKLDLAGFPIPTRSKDYEQTVALLLEHRNKLIRQVDECLAQLNYRRVSASEET